MAKKRKLDKGLKTEEAMKRFPYKPSYGDCRGFHYDKSTGVAQWI